MIGTHLLLLGFCSIKCFSMHPRLFIEIYVMSAVSVWLFSFKLTRWNNRPAYSTAELFGPVIMWLVIQFRIYTTLCKRDLSVKQSSPLHEPLGQCNYCRSATKQLDIYHIPGNQFICNNFERTFKVAQKVYWTGKSTTTVGATKQLDISHIPSKI